MKLWLQLQDKFKALQHREKVTMLVASVLLCLMIFVLQWLQPALEQQQADQQQLLSLNSQHGQDAELIQTLTQQMAIDPDLSLKAQIAELQQQDLQLQQEISKLTRYFIASEHMAAVLRDVLKSDNGVNVKLVKSSPPAPVTFAETDAKSTVMVFQHATQVVLTGDYQALSAVVQRLEALPWSLGWQQLDYKVTRYPTAELTLNLLTVSDNESYIKL